MLRAKIDLRQPSFLLRPRTVTATVSSQGLKEHPVPKVRCRNELAHHRDADVTQRSAHKRSLHRRSHELAA